MSTRNLPTPPGGNQGPPPQLPPQNYSSSGGYPAQPNQAPPQSNYGAPPQNNYGQQYPRSPQDQQSYGGPPHQNQWGQQGQNQQQWGGQQPQDPNAPWAGLLGGLQQLQSMQAQYAQAQQLEAQQAQAQAQQIQAAFGQAPSNQPPAGQAQPSGQIPQPASSQPTYGQPPAQQAGGPWWQQQQGQQQGQGPWGGRGGPRGGFWNQQQQDPNQQGPPGQWGGRGRGFGQQDPNQPPGQQGQWAPGQGQGRGGLAAMLGALGLGNVPVSPTGQVGFIRPTFDVQLTLEQKREFVKEGAILIKNVIPKDVLDRALRAINRHMAIPSDQIKNKLVPPQISACPDLMTSKVLMDLLYQSPAFEYIQQLVGKTNEIRGAQIALRHPGAGCVKAEATKHLGTGGVAQLLSNPLIAGIADQFWGQDEEDSNYVYAPSWHDYWHIDGFPDAIKQIQTGVVKNFTMLLGIYLSDAPEEYMGNFTIHPGSHHVLEKVFQEKGGVIKFLEPNSLEGIQVVRQACQGKIAPAKQIKVNAGDILLAHYQTAHSIAPNISSNIRYACYFRLHHHSHQVEEGKPDCLTNIWVDFDGVRDLAHEMKARGEI